MNRWRKYGFIAVFALVGAVAGYFYWKFYGCENGCSITSVWYRTAAYGALMGGLLGDMAFGWFFNVKEDEA